MVLYPDDLTRREKYKLLIGSVLPRPIAWVSTMDGQGNLNLAPFSFFTIGSRDPMTFIFCPQVPGDTAGKKDTLRNIEEVPEFVVNITNEETAEAMNRTATVLPRGQSEFEWAGVTPVPSESIRVPRVAEAPVAFECTLLQTVTISDQPGGGSAVFGEVRRIHIRDDIYVDGYVLMDVLKPIGRLAGADYARITDTFTKHRQPPPEDETWK